MSLPSGSKAGWTGRYKFLARAVARQRGAGALVFFQFILTFACLNPIGALKNIFWSFVLSLTLLSALTGGSMAMAVPDQPVQAAGEEQQPGQPDASLLYADFHFAPMPSGSLLPPSSGGLDLKPPVTEHPGLRPLPYEPVSFGEYRRTLFHAIISAKAP
jgi:hypothetical protein